MRNSLLIVTVFIGSTLTIPPAARAQTSSLVSETADAKTSAVDGILERAEEAAGGKAAWTAITAMHITGIVELPSGTMPASFELYSKAPERKYLSFALSNTDAEKSGFDGTKGWKNVPGRGIVDMQGEELENFKLASDFNVADLKLLFPHMATGVDTTVDGRLASTIIAAPLQGKARKFFFDKETGLEIGWSMETLEGGEGLPLEVRYGDFRIVHGVQIPYTIRQSSPKRTTTMRAQDVQVNPIVLNSIFIKPAENVESARTANSGSAFTGPHFGTGSVSRNTYTDPTFSFKYTFPANWTVRSQESEEQALRMVRQLESRGNPAMAAAADARLARTTRLLDVVQYSDNAAGRFNATIDVQSEKMDGVPGIQSGKDYLLNMEAGLKRAALPAEFGPEIRAATTAGKSFYRLDVDLPITIAKIHLAFFSTRIGDSILSFVFSTASTGDMEMLCKTLDSLQFEAPRH